MQYRNVKLYGGAITADLESDLIDASKFRQVPDTQEVYVCEQPKDLNASDALIIDLMERVNEPDEKAIGYHLNEICKLNDVKDSVILQQETHAKATHFPDSYTAWIISGEEAKKWGRDEVPLILILALIRLDKVKTDLLVSYNLPFHDQKEIEDLKKVFAGDKSTDNSALKRIDVGKEVVGHILDSLKVQNWELFKN